MSDFELHLSNKHSKYQNDSYSFYSSPSAQDQIITTSPRPSPTTSPKLSSSPWPPSSPSSPSHLPEDTLTTPLSKSPAASDLSLKRKRSDSSENDKDENEIDGDEKLSDGDLKSPKVSSTSRPQPLEILSKVFPHLKTETMQSVLDKSQGDILLSIESLLNQAPPHSLHPAASALGAANSAHVAAAAAARSALASSFLSSMTRPGGGLAVGGTAPPTPSSTLTPPSLPTLPPSTLTPASYLTPPLGLAGAGFKSAFSPISQPPTAHLNSIRYMYAAAAAASGRNVLLPYPQVMPNLSNRGYGYS